ncbi:type II secretion system F family protein [uncultured Methanomethylovorans sp.]|uniref:type II secretion system F family protein n=1 Tax=uncultured Methanomethylovorans sp. TaxID=183759 RepID=UPI00374903A3
MKVLTDEYIVRAYIYAILCGILAAFFIYTVSKGTVLLVFALLLTSNPLIYESMAPSYWTIIETVFSFVVMAYITFTTSLLIPGIRAGIRIGVIDQSLSHTVAFLYALSHGGAITILDMFRSLSEHREIYGAAAAEFTKIVNDVEYFGTDLLTALSNATRRSPSAELRDFLEGLSSVLSSGGNIGAYLGSKSKYFHDNAMKQQRMFFETLGVMAEVYISTFVAGPLFLMTILVVLGLINPSSTKILYAIIYLIIPISTVTYLLLLNSLTGQGEKRTEVYKLDKYLKEFDHVLLREDTENEKEKIKTIKFYEKIHKMTVRLLHPIKWMQANPTHTLLISVPICIVYLHYNLNKHIDFINLTSIWDFNTAALASIDKQLFTAMLIVVVPYVIFYELWHMRITKIDEQIPDFLKNLASMNESGMLLTDAIAFTTHLKIGILHTEVRRMHNELSWGATLSEALKKFEYRIRTEMTTKIVYIIIKATETTSNIMNVLTIAATDAEVQKQLKKERKSEMFVYVFIIYVAYGVFLFIVYILAAFFLPSMPIASTNANMGMPLIQLVDLDEYNVLLFHAAMIQGLCSGLVAGKMERGEVSAGLKYSLFMMFTAYLVFITFF